MAIYKIFIKHLLANGLQSYKPKILLNAYDPNTGSPKATYDLSMNCTINELDNGYTISCTASEVSPDDYVVKEAIVNTAYTYSVDGTSYNTVASYSGLNVRKTSTQRLDITFTLTLTAPSIAT